MNEMKLENLEITEVTATCQAGSVITDCIREAIVLAIEENRIVKFKFNDKEYVANPRALTEIIYAQNQ